MPNPIRRRRPLYIALVFFAIAVVMGVIAVQNQARIVDVIALVFAGFVTGLMLMIFLIGHPAPASGPARTPARQAKSRKARPAGGNGGERGKRAPDRKRSPKGKAAPSKPAPRVTGTVKWFDPSKGFGFITPENGEKDCFVHRSALDEGVTLIEGAQVKFEIIQDERGRRAAANVTVTP